MRFTGVFGRFNFENGSFIPQMAPFIWEYAYFRTVMEVNTDYLKTSDYEKQIS